MVFLAFPSLTFNIFKALLTRESPAQSIWFPWTAELLGRSLYTSRVPKPLTLASTPPAPRQQGR